MQWLVAVVLAVVAGILSVRLFIYHRQVSHILEELALLEQEDTNYEMSSFANVGRTDEMIAAFNRLALRYKEQQRQLKNENRIYRESITSISHDIRTPLTSAKGYIQMLGSASLATGKKEEYLRIVERRLDDLTDMLDKLFEYARIEAGELEFEPEEFYAGNLFAETLSMFYEEFKEKGVEPEVSITPEPCRLKTDKQAFIRICENLIRNALVHGIGGYCLSLFCRDNQAVISVSNLTDSIRDEDMDKIFDRFYTTDQSRSKKTTGLGLAIVKRLAGQMSGTAEASLKDGRFTVEVCIPLVKGQ